MYSSDVQCGFPQPAAEAKLKTENKTYRYLETAEYVCINPAAKVTQGNLTLTCGEDGDWLDCPPVCGKSDIRIEL